MHDDLDPRVAAALARAHNDWTRDFCAHNPDRLKFAAQLAFHDVPAAIAEARRAVRTLGAVAVIGNPNPIGGHHIHDPEFEPLWDAIEELGVPVGFHPTGQSSLRDDIAHRFLDHPNGRVIGGAGRNPMELHARLREPRRRGRARTSPPAALRLLSRARAAGSPGGFWRLDETWEKFGPGSEVQISALPSEYFLPAVLRSRRTPTRRS